MINTRQVQSFNGELIKIVNIYKCPFNMLKR